MDWIINFLSNNLISGFLAGVLSALASQKISKFLYIHRNGGVPEFEYDKAFTFAQDAEFGLFTIIDKSYSYIEAEICFRDSTTSNYAGLVFTPNNSNFSMFVNKGFKINFSLSLHNIDTACLEIKSNHNKKLNAVFLKQTLTKNKIEYEVELKSTYKDKNLWEDITEFVFLINKQSTNGTGKIVIRKLRISK